MQVSETGTVDCGSLRLGDDLQPVSPICVPGARARDQTCCNGRLPHDFAPLSIPSCRYRQPDFCSVEVRNRANISRDLIPTVFPESSKEVDDEVNGLLPGLCNQIV